jgi:hypothetical protein
MHLKKTGYGGGRAARGGSMYERVLIPLDGSDIAENDLPSSRRSVVSSGTTEPNGRDAEEPC